MNELEIAPSSKKKSSEIIEIIIVLVQATLLALFIRTFLFQPFVIPSGSMRPTLLVGDYLFVSKYAYGYSRYSLPFSPNLFSNRIWGEEPKRGDIVVFRHLDVYAGDEKDYIKRVIGLPGDTIQVINGLFYINDKPIKREFLGKINDRDITGVFGAVDMYQETLPNGVTYKTLDLSAQAPGNDTKEFVVPPHHYFMMGDNRDDSEDSRFSLGYISYEQLIGRANLIFFSMANNTNIYKIWRWPSDVRWDRIFTFVTTPRSYSYISNVNKF